MERQQEEGVEWIVRQAEQDKANEARYPDYKERFPYETVLVDQYQGHCEYGYDTVSRYATLEEAVASARKITEEALMDSGSVESWHGMGDAGLVYDGSRKLVWDGVREYTNHDGSEEVFAALEYAVKAHAGQYRKGTNIPYIVHPLGVAKILMGLGCPNKIVIASLLHDTVEDTTVTYQGIEEKFGRYVAGLVRWVSEPDKSESWKARKLHTMETLQKAPLDAVLIACADKLDNIRAMRADYAKEGEGFWGRFNAPKGDIKWYYSALCELFKGLGKYKLPDSMAGELEEEVNAVFR